jgi:predicted MFS family arabinose efflux permease
MSAGQPVGSGLDSGHPLLSRGYRTWLVVVLLALSTLNFADRAILSVLAQPIKEDLGLTDTQLGMLQGLGFAIFYSLLGLPLGWLAERINRKTLIAACVAVWSFMTAVCGFASGFATLLLGRVGVGIGEAGFQPAASSLIADHYRPDRRGSVMSIVLLGSPIGFLVGQAFGGWVAATWGWREAFLALGVPGLLAALVTWLTLREPPRGLAEGQVSPAPAPSLRQVFATLRSKPTFHHLLIGFALTGFAMNAVAQFVLPFYLRGFGLPLATAGAIFGAVAFTSNGLGMLAGGFGFDRLATRDPRWSLWGPALMLVLATPLYLGAFISREVTWSLAFIWFANLSLATYLAPSLATFQNLVGPRMRALTIAIAFLVMGLIGSGLGPTLLGITSDWFAARAFTAGEFLQVCPGGRGAAGADAAVDAACRAASAQGLRMALVSVLVFFLWGAVHFLLAARTLGRDRYSPPAA